MRILNLFCEKRMVFFFLFFLGTIELLDAETKLLNLIRKQSMDIEDFKSLVKAITYYFPDNLYKITEDNRIFRVQKYSSRPKVIQKGHDYCEIRTRKSVYTYDCPSTVDRAIREIVAVDYTKDEEYETPIGDLGGWMLILEKNPNRLSISCIEKKQNVVITFDGSKVKFSPEDIIKAYGLKRKFLEKNGSLLIPYPISISKEQYITPSPLRCKFIANRLVELQFSLTKSP